MDNMELIAANEMAIRFCQMQRAAVVAELGWQQGQVAVVEAALDKVMEICCGLLSEWSQKVEQAKKEHEAGIERYSGLAGQEEQSHSVEASRRDSAKQSDDQAIGGGRNDQRQRKRNPRKL